MLTHGGAAIQALWDGLRGIGLEPFVEDPAFRLATVNTIKVRLETSDGSHHVTRVLQSSAVTTVIWSVLHDWNSHRTFPLPQHVLRHAVQVPEGIDWAKLNAYVMDKYRCGVSEPAGNPRDLAGMRTTLQLEVAVCCLRLRHCIDMRPWWGARHCGQSRTA